MNSLQLACQNNNVFRVLELINGGSDLNAASNVAHPNWVKQQEAAKLPLYIAQERGHLLIAKILLLCGTDKKGRCQLPVLTSNDLIILLLTAIAKNYGQVVHLVIRHLHRHNFSNEDLTLLSQAKPHLLAFAAARQQFDLLRELRCIEGLLFVPGTRSMLYWALRYEAPGSVIEEYLLQASTSAAAALEALHFLREDGEKENFENFYRRLSETGGGLLEKLDNFSVSHQISSSSSSLPLITSKALLAANRHDAFLLKQYLKSTEIYEIIVVAFKKKNYVAVMQILEHLPDKRNLARQAVDQDRVDIFNLIAMNELNMYPLVVSLLQEHPESFRRFSRENSHMESLLQAIFWHKDREVLQCLLNFWLGSPEDKEKKVLSSTDLFAHLKPEEKKMLTDALLRSVQDEHHVDLRLLTDSLPLSPAASTANSEILGASSESKREMKGSSLAGVPQFPSVNERLRACHEAGYHLDPLALRYVHAACKKWNFPFDRQFLPASKTNLLDKIPNDLWIVQKEEQKKDQGNISAFLDPLDRACLARTSRRFSRLIEQPHELQKIMACIKAIKATVHASANKRAFSYLTAGILTLAGTATGVGIMAKKFISSLEKYASLFVQAEHTPGDSSQICTALYLVKEDGQNRKWNFCDNPQSKNVTKACLALAAQLCDIGSIESGFLLGVISGGIFLLCLLICFGMLVRNIIVKQGVAEREAALANFSFAYLPPRLQEAILTQATLHNLPGITLDTSLDIVCNDLEALLDRLRRVVPLRIRTESPGQDAPEENFCTPLLPAGSHP